MNASIRELLAEIVGDDVMAEIEDDDLLLEQGLVDSMHLVELVTLLEERLRAPVDSEDLVPENFESVAAIARFAEAKRARA